MVQGNGKKTEEERFLTSQADRVAPFGKKIKIRISLRRRELGRLRGVSWSR